MQSYDETTRKYNEYLSNAQKKALKQRAQQLSMMNAPERIQAQSEAIVGRKRQNETLSNLGLARSLTRAPSSGLDEKARRMREFEQQMGAFEAKETAQLNRVGEKYKQQTIAARARQAELNRRNKATEEIKEAIKDAMRNGMNAGEGAAMMRQADEGDLANVANTLQKFGEGLEKNRAFVRNAFWTKAAKQTVSDFEDMQKRRTDLYFQNLSDEEFDAKLREAREDYEAARDRRDRRQKQTLIYRETDENGKRVEKSRINWTDDEEAEYQKIATKYERFKNYKSERNNERLRKQYSGYFVMDAEDLKTEKKRLEGLLQEERAASYSLRNVSGAHVEEWKKEAETRIAKMQALEDKISLIGLVEKQHARDRRQERYESMRSVENARDFEEYAQKGANLTLVTSEKDAKNMPDAIKSDAKTELTYAIINGGVEEADARLFGGGVNTQQQRNEILSLRESTQLMTQEEKQGYNYRFAKYGAEAANAYLDRLQTYINERRMEQLETMAKADATKVPWLSEISQSLISVLATPFEGLGELYVLYSEITGKEIDPYHPSFRASVFKNATRTAVADEIAKAIYDGGGSEALGSALAFGYQTLMGVADNALLLYMGKGIGTFGTTAKAAQTITEVTNLGIMSLNAAADTTRQALLNGATQEQAVALGLFAGAWEAVFEKVSLDNLLNMPKLQASSWISRTLTQAGVEASEEFCTEMANTLTNMAILGSESDYNSAVTQYMLNEGYTRAEAESLAMLEQIQNIGMAAAGGFLSGGMMGGFHAAVSDVQTRRIGQTIKSSGGMQTLLEEASKIRDNGIAEKLYAKLNNAFAANKNLSNMDVGRMNFLVATSELPTINGTIDRFVQEGKLTKQQGEKMKGLFEQRAMTEGVTGIEQSAEEAAEWRQFDAETLNELYLTVAKQYGQQNTKAETNKREVAERAAKQKEQNNENPLLWRAESRGERAGEIDDRIYRLNGETASELEIRRENQNRDAYLSTLPYATDQGVRNKASRITLPAMLADTTDAKRRWAEANEIEVPEGFRGLPMRFETEQQSARSAEPGERLTQSSLTANTKKVQTQRGVTIRLHKYTDLSQLSNTERDALKLAQAVKMLGVTNVEAHDTLSANGMYDPTTNTVHFALDAENPIAALSHELAHYIEYHAGEKYGEFVEFLQQQANAARRNGWDTLVQEKLEQYADATRSEADMQKIAESEAIAEMCEDLLRSETRFREFIQRDRTLGERIVDFFDDILRNLRQLIPTRSARGASTMIRDVEKARDYYWSLLEEAKGQETAGQDRIAQAKRGDTSNLYRGAYTENGELLVDTITEDEYNENANLHRQIQLGKARYKEVLREANRANAEEFFERGHLSKLNSVVVGKTRYMYMNFSDQNVGDGVNMIVTDTARVGTKTEAILLQEVEDLNGRQRSREASADRPYDAGDGRTINDQAGRNQKDRSFGRENRSILGVSESESHGDARGGRRGNGPAGTNDSSDAGRSADSPRDGRGGHAVSIGHAATNESTDTGAFSLRETPWGIRESRRTFPEREARPALERAREILGSTQERYEDGRKIPTGKEVAQLLAGGLHANRGWGLKDVVRNIDAFAGKNTEVRNRLEEMIERPFNEAGGAYARNLKARTTAFVETMKALDIRTKQDSAAVQRWGEGVRQNQYGELVEYTLADLQRECPDNWRNVQRAAEVCRGIYEGYVDELNAMLEQIYPNVIEHAETDAERLQQYIDLERDRIGNQRRVITEIENRIEGKRDALKQRELPFAGKARTKTQAYANLQNELATLELRLQNAKALLERYEQRAIVRETQKAEILQAIESGEVLRNRRVLKRADYFHHFQEMEEGFGALANIFRTNFDIDPQLAGKSAETKPKSKWAGFMQQRGQGRYQEDAVSGMLRYMNAAEYKLAYDPVSEHLRTLEQEVRSEAGHSHIEANDFLKWIGEWRNSLLGKSNSFDRVASDSGIVGRKAIQIARWINSRVKSNAVLGNMRSAIVQISNITNAAAYIPNPQDWINGARSYLAARTSADMQSIMERSNFLSQRYMDIQNPFEKTSAAKRVALWMLQVGDKEAAKLMWWSAYQQFRRSPENAQRVGGMNYQNAVEYADDITRRSVGGRGVGELPTMLNSQLLNLIGPFQVEVTNTWNNMVEQVGKKNAKGLIAFEITTFVLNTLFQAAIGDRPLPFDMIEAIVEAIKNAADDEGKWYEDVLGGLQGAAAEVGKGVPFVAQIAPALLSEETTQMLFGSDDPTRGGTANIGISAIGDTIEESAELIKMVLSGNLNSADKIWTALLDRTSGLNLLMPWGATQLVRTAKGIDTVVRGYSQKLNSAGEAEAQFAVDQDVGELIKAAVFGKWSLSEGQDYLGNWSILRDIAGDEQKAQPRLNAETTEDMKEAARAGIRPKQFFEIENSMRGMESVRDEDGNTIDPKTAQQAERVASDKTLTNVQKLLMTKQINQTLYEHASEAYAKGVPTDVFLELYAKKSRFQPMKDENGKTIKTTSDYVREALLREKTLTEAQKRTLDEILIGSNNSRDYRSEAWFELSSNEASYQRAQEAEKSGVNPETYLKYANMQAKYSSDADEETGKDEVLQAIMEDASMSPQQKAALEQAMYHQEGKAYVAKDYTDGNRFYLSLVGGKYPEKGELAQKYGISLKSTVTYVKRYRQAAAEKTGTGKNGAVNKRDCFSLMERAGIPKDKQEVMYRIMTGKIRS